MKNKTFLEYVAEDIVSRWGADLSRTAVVFPNKRAALFMNDHLAKIAGKPIWSPAYITISELFQKHSGLVSGDSIKLICDLHKVFLKCTGLDESIDHFYGWGQLLLADFDDIDKNMADADKIFCNLKDLHEFDDTSYLSDEQREMLKQFFVNFTDNQETELKKRFLCLWSHFSDIYHCFNERLKQQGIGYEGAIYREVVTKQELEFQYDRYLFVGFNMLQKVERKLFERIKQQDKAFFYWDYDIAYMPKAGQTRNSDAGHYIASYQKDFPNMLDGTRKDIYDNLRRGKDITYISASTERAQANYVSTWLRENNRAAAGRRTAVVMCDENILQSILHCLPPEADKVNITSGYPLGMTPIATLVSQLMDLYTVGCRPKRNCYALHYVSKVLRHPYARHISVGCAKLSEYLHCHKQFYPSHSLLTAQESDEGLCLLFPNTKMWMTDASKDINENKRLNVCTLMLQIGNVVQQIGMGTKDEKDALFQESVFRMYTVVNRLLSLSENGDLEVDTTTLRRLLKQLIDSTTIPFHGEPVVGIQIMGVLETRNLDFDHILLLSCNEGNMPKGVNDSSFIPYSIRKAYELTTIDNKVAIYSYYFHSLLQRVGDITLVYNNATDNGHTGEMSRFMLELMIDDAYDIVHKSMLTENVAVIKAPKPMKKDSAIMKHMNQMESISPSAINQYIRCQLSFFYKHVARIAEPDDNEDDEVDNRMFGNIFHKAAFLIYTNIAERSETVEKAHIMAYMKNSKMIEDVVDRAFDEELFKTGSINSEYNGMQVINREVIIEYVKQLLRIDIELTPFKIIALEKEAYGDFCIGESKRNIRIGGIIDRLDKVVDKNTGKEAIRVVDYKTGHQPTSKIAELGDIFTGTNTSKSHSDYYLQTMLYSLIVRESGVWNPDSCAVSPALLFIKHASKTEYDPVLEIGNERIEDIKIYDKEFKKSLMEKVEEIFDSNIAFSPTEDKKKCEMCPYKMLCYT